MFQLRVRHFMFSHLSKIISQIDHACEKYEGDELLVDIRKSLSDTAQVTSQQSCQSPMTVPSPPLKTIPIQKYGRPSSTTRTTAYGTHSRYPHSQKASPTSVTTCSKPTPTPSSQKPRRCNTGIPTHKCPCPYWQPSPSQRYRSLPR